MTNNYETYYKNLILNIEGLAENPDRLTVPELLDELSELAICNRNLILNNEIEETFRYQFMEVNQIFSLHTEPVALYKLKDIFNFDSKLKFIINFNYHDDVMKFLDKNFEKINYIMDYLKNRVDSIIAEHTSDNLSEDDIAEINAAIDEDDE